MAIRARALRRAGPLAALAAAAVLVLAPASADAALKAITVAPNAPTTCDTVTIRVEGETPSSCYTVVGAEIAGPEPVPDAMSPIPTYSFRVRVRVQEQDPRLELPCVQQVTPYAREFAVGQLSPGIYWVRALEVVWTYGDGETPAPSDSSSLSASFHVARADTCPPGEGCVFLGFQSPGRDGPRLCDAAGLPGGEGCFDVTLMNPVPVGGVQLAIDLTDLRLSPLPMGTFTPKSVTTAGRAEGFQVAWEPEGSAAKVLLFSTTGAAIEPGRGPILHVCYGIGTDVRVGAYRIYFAQSLIADPDGARIPDCPTFVEVTGRFCVGSPDCDLNGDGRSDILDVILLARCALRIGTGGACPDSIAALADCNEDGSVDVRDVICCVRRILAAGGPDVPNGVGTTGDGMTRIGFSGPVRWITPVDGRATIELAANEDFAGIQFRLAPSGPVRIRGMRLLEGDPGAQVVQLNWAVGSDGIARAMLHAGGGIGSGGGSGGTAAAVSAPVTIEVMVEPTPGGAGENASLSIRDAASANRAAAFAPTVVSTPTVEVPKAGISAPTVFPAKPNPFVSETEIAYALPSPGRASLRVYDVRGRLVRVLVDGPMPAGVQRARWDGRDASGRTAASGIYFVKLGAGGLERSERILKLR
jgi:hypothetical protein